MFVFEKPWVFQYGDQISMVLVSFGSMFQDVAIMMHHEKKWSDFRCYDFLGFPWPKSLAQKPVSSPDVDRSPRRFRKTSPVAKLKSREAREAAVNGAWVDVC